MASFELEEVKHRATGHWAAIANRVAGIGDDFLTTRHGPCPKCGGNDRWRVFGDFAETGGAICNQCGKFGDGISLVQWYTGSSFPDVLRRVGTFLGVEPSKNGKAKRNSDASANLVEIPWDEYLVRLWCLRKKPITPEAIQAVGGRLARYRDRYTVIALPAYGQDGSVVGWTLYEVGGGKLPVFHGKGNPITWESVKQTTGSRSGWIG